MFCTPINCLLTVIIHWSRLSSMKPTARSWPSAHDVYTYCGMIIGMNSLYKLVRCDAYVCLCLRADWTAPQYTLPQVLPLRNPHRVVRVPSTYTYSPPLYLLRFITLSTTATTTTTTTATSQWSLHPNYAFTLVAELHVPFPILNEIPGQLST